MKVAPILILATVLAGSGGLGLASDLKPRVFAVNAPLAHFAEKLGGDDITVTYLPDAGVDPAFWKPEPRDIQAAQESDLILLNGAGYAGWAKSAILPRSRIVDTSSLFHNRLIPEDGDATTHKHGPEGQHSGGDGYAFTTWLDPDLAVLQLDATVQAMIVQWPDMEPAISARQAMIVSEIAEMDDAFSNFFDTVGERQIITSHPVYQYLERRYDQSFLNLHWEPDVMPSPEEWRRFENLLISEQKPLMIWEGEPTAEIAERLKQQGVEWLAVSPFSNEPDRRALFARIGAQVSNYR